MSFRARLVLAFAGLAIILAVLFTLLSEALLRHGMEGEANQRLALVASFYRLPEKAAAVDSAALKTFAERFELHSAALLFPDGRVVDSRGPASGKVEEYTLADGVLLPKALTGTASVSVPLFQDGEGRWVKALYVKMHATQDLWLRLEAGTRLLGSVSALRKRLFGVAVALGVPALAAGILLAWTLSRRARQLQRSLEGRPTTVSLNGTDEFAKVGAEMDRVLKALADERREKERLHRAKLSQAKSLSWGVAHELRNPLGGLSLLGEMARRKMAEGAPQGEVDELLERMKAEIARMENTVATFLEFARTPELKPEAVNPAALLGRMIAGRKPAPAMEGDCPALRADRKALEMVLSVLLTNAGEAAGMDGGVKITLAPDRDGGLIRVWDSGPPVPEKERDKVFNPFFTTKAKGMGLGLANAAALVDAMDGTLLLEDDGKTFQLWLPADAPGRGAA